MVRATPDLLIFACLVLLLQPLWSLSATSGKPICREEERSALLGFKISFFNESNCFSGGSSSGKMMAWKAEEGKTGDCCYWGGVTCDEKDGHVIGLDLSGSCLSGRIESKAGIFDLVHLQELNLAYNSFDGSPIPSAIGHLTRLTRLNLSSSGFGGNVLPEMMMLLSNLSSLDLSRNMEMNIPGLEELLRSLNKIEEIDLRWVMVSDGKVPRSLGNMTSLRSLVLFGCGLSGEFPDSVFELPRLEFLDVSNNDGLTGRLTGFHRGSPIKNLKLSGMNLTGEVWISLGNLSHLTEIDLSSCGLWGEIPSSIGELTKLEFLNLASNKFHGPIPFSLGNLTNLTTLDLYRNRLSGDIPSSLGNLVWLNQLYLFSNQLVGGIPLSLMQLSQLSELDLSSNMLTGSVPSQISNLSQLNYLVLSSNKFHGPIPHSIYGLKNLTDLFLESNYLSGVARLDLFLGLREQALIDLSSNAFSSIIFPEPDANVSQIKGLGLGSCSLTEVPRFLKGYQNKWNWLILSNNNISGQIPQWLLQRTLYSLDLRFNYFHGTLPTQLNSIQLFLVSNNRLSGEIPSSICELENKMVLDLADNDFTGVLPPCFGNLSFSFGAAFSLSGNNFTGKIPEFNKERCALTTMDLSSNSFEGPLPRSLVNCPRLKYVNFGRNKIRDTFPSWLGSLPSLKVLMLHSNRFHGEMNAPRNESWFPSLKVITLSKNSLQGRLPADYFPHLQAMKYFSLDDDEYPGSFVQMITMTIIDKGIEREFGKTLGSFSLLDLSSNNFSGTIPNTIGDNLLKLRTLNLSNNVLSGPIPQSLANLKNLEVLDLSRNRLSGEIPRMLMQVTSLGIFNVSYNNLSGAIPWGNQFGTFENSSYIGNPGLCGTPLTKKCGNPPQFPPSPACNQEEKSNLPFGIIWITALAGLAGGLVVGVALEQAFGTDILCWLERKWRMRRRNTA